MNRLYIALKKGESVYQYVDGQVRAVIVTEAPMTPSGVYSLRFPKGYINTKAQPRQNLYKTEELHILLQSMNQTIGELISERDKVEDLIQQSADPVFALKDLQIAISVGIPVYSRIEYLEDDGSGRFERGKYHGIHNGLAMIRRDDGVMIRITPTNIKRVS